MLLQCTHSSHHSPEFLIRPLSWWTLFLGNQNPSHSIQMAKPCVLALAAREQWEVLSVPFQAPWLELRSCYNIWDSQNISVFQWQKKSTTGSPLCLKLFNVSLRLIPSNIGMVFKAANTWDGIIFHPMSYLPLFPNLQPHSLVWLIICSFPKSSWLLTSISMRRVSVQLISAHFLPFFTSYSSTATPFSRTFQTHIC